MSNPNENKLDDIVEGRVEDRIVARLLRRREQLDRDIRANAERVRQLQGYLSVVAHQNPGNAVPILQEMGQAPFVLTGMVPVAGPGGAAAFNEEHYRSQVSEFINARNRRALIELEYQRDAQGLTNRLGGAREMRESIEDTTSERERTPSPPGASLEGEYQRYVPSDEGD